MHLLEVTVQTRSHRRLGQSRLPTGHQTRHRTHLVRTDHLLKTQPLHHGGTGLLVLGVAMGVHQCNHGLPNAGLQRRADLACQLLTGHKRRQLMAIGGESTGQFDHSIRKERTGRLHQGEQIVAMLIADAEEIAETSVGQQQQRLPLSLQQGIGGDRRPQTHAGHQRIG